jgi:hypothetical protein
VIPTTSGRVPASTSDEANRRIRQQTQERIARYRGASREMITQRLAELDREWDVERCLEANAATACLVGVTLGATADRRWFYLPAVIGGFLLQHAVQGWCPPLPVFRRLGFRTQREIEEERLALKVLRGDFDRLDRTTPVGADVLLDAVEK